MYEFGRALSPLGQQRAEPVSELAEDGCVLFYHHDKARAFIDLEPHLAGHVLAEVAGFGGGSAGKDAEWGVGEPELPGVLANAVETHCSQAVLQKCKTVPPNQVSVDTLVSLAAEAVMDAGEDDNDAVSGIDCLGGQ